MKNIDLVKILKRCDGYSPVVLVIDGEDVNIEKVRVRHGNRVVEIVGGGEGGDPETEDAEYPDHPVYPSVSYLEGGNGGENDDL